MEVLSRKVRRPENTDFEIRWHTTPEFHNSAALLRLNCPKVPILAGIFAVMDGLKMPCATYTILELQNTYWERFTLGDEVRNLFVWNFHGECIHAMVDFPGSWRDSKLASSSG